MAKSLFNASMDFPAAAAQGIVKGVTNYSTFGIAENLQASIPKDLTFLPVNDIPLPANAGEALEIVSDNAGDTALIEIAALGPNAEYLEPFVVQLNGTTPVPLPGLISRINGADSVDPVGYVGELSIQQSGGGTVFAIMTAIQQQLTQAHYTVPAGKKWMVGNLIGTMQKSSGTDTDVVLTVLFKGFNQAQYRRPFGFGLQRSGDTSVEFDNKYPSVVRGPADIKLAAESSSAGATVAGWISGLLFDYTPEGS